MKKELFKTLVSDLKADVFFSDYKYIRSDNTFWYNSGADSVFVDLFHWRDYWDDNCVIRPVYCRHFDILSKWFEKFSVMSIKDQRYYPHIMRYNDTAGQDPEFEFKYDFSDYEEKFQQFSNILKDNITRLVNTYSTVNDFYTKYVLRRTFGDQELPDVGADWIFFYLTSGFLLDKENYPALKKKVLERAEWMVNREEPNIVNYYDRMDEIISYMENNVKFDECVKA